MKVAFIVECHKNSSQINRMIKALDYPGFDFYIHVDKKSAIQDELIRRDNIFFVEDTKRVSVCWGQISQVDAIIVLLKAAIFSKTQYDYIWLISGQDYPIKSIKDISRYLSENQGISFIQPSFIHSSGNTDIHNEFLKRNMLWYPRWMVSPGLLGAIIRKIYVIVTGGATHTFGLMKRKQLSNITYYFGSSWFAITKEAGEYILSYLDKNPNYYRFFKNTLCPDECFFQTILYNSPLKERMGDCLCYVDWSELKKNPKILLAEDFGKLIQSKYLIARKFDLHKDSKILDMLDLHNQKG